MDEKEFLELVWQLDEILMLRDHLQNQIDTCEQGSGDDEGLCPECSELFEEVLAEDQRLAKSKELSEVQKKLQQAIAEDKSGLYQRILDQSRDNNMVH